MEDYFSKLHMAILFSEQYANLDAKSELDTDIAESYTVSLAKSLSQTMARHLGYNYEKAGVLALCKGVVFPPYGKAGMAYIRTKMQQENVCLSDEEICMSFLKYKLKEGFFEIPDEFADDVKELFSEDPAEGEAKIVNVIYEMIRGIETIKRSNEDMASELENSALDIFYDAVFESEAHGKITQSKELKRMMANIVDEGQFELGEREKAVIDDLWTEYRDQKLSVEDIAVNVVFGREK